eukprot:Rhum_TRINITY_DN15119_c7_g1::Rhum_TRINITY_DN15119_c7_g1_i1::g.139513::m.139513
MSVSLVACDSGFVSIECPHDTGGVRSLPSCNYVPYHASSLDAAAAAASGQQDQQRRRHSTLASSNSTLTSSFSSDAGSAASGRVSGTARAKRRAGFLPHSVSREGVAADVREANRVAELVSRLSGGVVPVRRFVLSAYPDGTVVCLGTGAREDDAAPPSPAAAAAAETATATATAAKPAPKKGLMCRLREAVRAEVRVVARSRALAGVSVTVVGSVEAEDAVGRKVLGVVDGMEFYEMLAKLRCAHTELLEMSGGAAARGGGGAASNGSSDGRGSGEQPEECSVCLVSAVDLILPGCSHAFCASCILSWSQVRRAASCPMCRTPIGDVDDTFYLYRPPPLAERIEFLSAFLLPPPRKRA